MIAIPSKQKNNRVQKIINEYEERADQIIRRMLQVSVIANRKIDGISYKKWKEKINECTAGKQSTTS